MKILYINLCDYPLPPPSSVIRADTYISIPLAERMQKNGHDVRFLCAKGSTLQLSMTQTTYGGLSNIISLEQLMKKDLILARELYMTFYSDIFNHLIKITNEEHFDLVHFHTNVPLSELVAVSQIKPPCLFTLHSVLNYDRDIYKSFFTYLNNRKNNYFSSISHYQQTTYEGVPFYDVIHNGIELENFIFNSTGSENLIFAGRIIPEKGIKQAINAALITKHQFYFTGHTHPSNDREFYEREIIPLYENNKTLIHFINHVDRKDMYSFYGKGKATLNPIQWEEPFGLVQIESMASGTPIITFARGSVPEVIRDGVTGFVVNPSEDDIRGNWIIKKTGQEGIIEAINRIYSMSENDYKAMRIACRKHVEDYFSFDLMVEKYNKVYNSIISYEPKTEYSSRERSGCFGKNNTS